MRTIREVMDLKIDDLEFSVRCRNCMKNMRVETLSDLTSHSVEEISKTRNVGKRSIEEINSKLAEIGLAWKMTDLDWVKWGLSHLAWIKANWFRKRFAAFAKSIFQKCSAANHELFCHQKKYRWFGFLAVKMKANFYFQK